MMILKRKENVIFLKSRFFTRRWLEEMSTIFFNICIDKMTLKSKLMILLNFPCRNECQKLYVFPFFIEN